MGDGEEKRFIVEPYSTYYLHPLEGPGNSQRAQMAVPRLSWKQVERLLCLINTPKPGYERLLGKNLCMLDSGVSAHMVCDINLVSNLQRISPTAIGLPNSDYTMARDTGSVTLGDGIKLDNVLYLSLIHI